METTKASRKRMPELESHLGYWLRRVSNAVSGGFARALLDKQTSIAEWVVLRELHGRDQAAPGELAEALGLTRGAVSKIIDKLEAKGWIRAEGKEGDGRSHVLSLSREGLRSLPLLAQIAERNEETFFDCLDAKERSILRKLLTKVAEHNRIHDVPTD